MQPLFVEYELALKLKEAGFVSPGYAFYDSNGNFHPSVQSVEAMRECFNSPLEEYDKDDTVFVEFSPNAIEDVEEVNAPIYQQVFDWLEERGYRMELEWLTDSDRAMLDLFDSDISVPRFTFVQVVQNGNRLAARKNVWDTAIEEALKLLKEKLIKPDAL